MKRTFISTVIFFFLLNLSAQPTIQRVQGSPYPYSAAPDKLYLTSENYSYSQKITVQTLQGILAKTKPEILRDTHGHRAVIGKYVPIDVTYYNNFQGLLTKYASRLSGYILCDAKAASTNVAISLSGILNAVAVPADIESAAITSGLTMVLDVRGKNEAWALANYGTQFSKTIASYQNCSDDRGLYLGDYSAYAGAFQFWDDSATGTLAMSAYNRMNVGATFFGWGAGEYATVEQLSKKSMLIHPADFSPNLSTISNVPVLLPKQKEAVNAFKVVPNVHTVCFVMSDGDNIQWLSGTSDNTNNWANPNRARVNMGWTISPAFAELAPAIYKKYVENNLTTSEGRNCLVAAPSGVGYYFPGIFPDLANQCDLLNRYMKKADLSIVNILDVDLGAHNPNQYLRQSNIDALFYYTYGANYTGMNGKISWYKDKPSIGGRYTLWGTLSSPDALAEKLNAASTNIYTEAGYSLIPVHVWSRDVDDILDCIKMLDANVRVVAPDEFVWLVRKNLKGINLGNGNGLKAEYFKGNNLDTLKYTQQDGKVDFDWGTASPNATQLGNDNFSVRWSGKIQSVYSEKHTFLLTADDGVKLTINGRVLVDSLNASGLKTYTDTMTMVAGIQYDIVLEYNEKTGNALCNLEWEGTSQMRQTVPRTQLYSRPVATTGVVTAYADCSYAGFSGGLKIGDYTLADLTNLGIYDNDIASLKVSPGFKVVLYENDNFSGESVEITSDSACLNNWSDKVSSLKVKANGEVGLDGIYYLRNKLSNLNMDVTGAYEGVADGAKIIQTNATTAINQQFKLVHLGDGVYSVINMNSQKSLEVEGLSLSDGAAIQQWADYKAANQQFILVKARSQGDYRMIACQRATLRAASEWVNQAPVRQYYDYNQSKAQWKLMPVAALVNANGVGLDAKYYNGMNFESLRYSTVDSTINFNWGTAAPYAKTNVDQFSVRWEGKIQPRFSGNYTFFINSDNGRRLWINNQLIIDKWLSDYGVEYSGSISLSANQKYSIKLEYFEDAGGASCILEWKSNMQNREVVPKSQLFPLNTAIDDSEVAVSDATIYPNPVTNKIMHISLKNNVENFTVKFYNMIGDQVFEKICTNDESLNLSEIPKGIYIVSIQNKTLNLNKRIVIQ